MAYEMDVIAGTNGTGEKDEAKGTSIKHLIDLKL